MLIGICNAECLNIIETSGFLAIGFSVGKLDPTGADLKRLALAKKKVGFGRFCF